MDKTEKERKDIKGILKKLKSSKVSKMFGNTNTRFFELSFINKTFGYKNKETETTFVAQYPFSEIQDFSEKLTEEEKKLCDWKYGFNIKLSSKLSVLYAESEEDYKKWTYALKLILKRIPEAFPLIPINVFQTGLTKFYYPYVKETEEKKNLENQEKLKKEKLENEKSRKEKEEEERRLKKLRDEEDSKFKSKREADLERARKLKEEDIKRKQIEEEQRLIKNKQDEILRKKLEEEENKRRIEEEKIRQEDEIRRIRNYEEELRRLQELEMNKNKYKLYDDLHDSIFQEAESTTKEEDKIKIKNLKILSRLMKNSENIEFKEKDVSDWNYYDGNHNKIREENLINFNPVLINQNKKMGPVINSVIKGYLDPVKRKSDLIFLENMHLNKIDNPNQSHLDQSVTGNKNNYGGLKYVNEIKQNYSILSPMEDVDLGVENINSNNNNFKKNSKLFESKNFVNNLQSDNINPNINKHNLTNSYSPLNHILAQRNFENVKENNQNFVEDFMEIEKETPNHNNIKKDGYTSKHLLLSQIENSNKNNKIRKSSTPLILIESNLLNVDVVKKSKNLVEVNYHLKELNTKSNQKDIIKNKFVNDIVKAQSTIINKFQVMNEDKNIFNVFFGGNAELNEVNEINNNNNNNYINENININNMSNNIINTKVNNLQNNFNENTENNIKVNNSKNNLNFSENQNWQFNDIIENTEADNFSLGESNYFKENYQKNNSNNLTQIINLQNDNNVINNLNHTTIPYGKKYTLGESSPITQIVNKKVNFFEEPNDNSNSKNNSPPKKPNTIRKKNLRQVISKGTKEINTINKIIIRNDNSNNSTNQIKLNTSNSNRPPDNQKLTESYNYDEERNLTNHNMKMSISNIFDNVDLSNISFEEESNLKHPIHKRKVSINNINNSNSNNNSNNINSSINNISKGRIIFDLNNDEFK